MAVNKALREEAEKLGISVDSRWSETTLRERIDEKKADNEAAGPGGIVPGSDPSADKQVSKEAAAGAAVDHLGKVLPTEATPKAIHGGLAVDEKALLRQKAERLLIMVDDKWDEGRLRGEIQMAREGRADLQVKGAVPPSEYSDVNYDPATKQDKLGVEPGLIRIDPVKIPGVTIAGEPAVALPGAAGPAVAASSVARPTK